MNYAFIINPIAGGVDRFAEIKSVAEAVLPHDALAFYRTEYEGHATELARKIAEKGEEVRVIACGGDGTLNEVLCGVYGHQNAALGLIPCGTGNDFVKAFEGGKAAFAPQYLAALKERTVDTLTVNGRPCLNIASVGFDCAVGANVHKFSGLPGMRGSAYMLSLAYSFFTGFHHKLTLLCDGVRDEGDFVFVCAANGKCYGGGFFAAPEADMSDGLIDLVTVKGMSRAEAVTMISTYKSGRHIKDGKSLHPKISLHRTKSLQILAEKEVDVNIDGEIVAMKDPQIEIHEASLRLLVPAAE